MAHKHLHKLTRHLRMLVGAALVLLACLGWAQNAEAETLVHVVRSGQNLGMIAKRYHTTVRAIERSNGLRRGQKLRVGQKLRIHEVAEHRKWRRFYEKKLAPRKAPARAAKPKAVKRAQRKTATRKSRKTAQRKSRKASARKTAQRKTRKASARTSRKSAQGKAGRRTAGRSKAGRRTASRSKAGSSKPRRARKQRAGSRSRPSNTRQAHARKRSTARGTRASAAPRKGAAGQKSPRERRANEKRSRRNTAKRTDKGSDRRRRASNAKHNSRKRSRSMPLYQKYARKPRRKGYVTLVRHSERFRGQLINSRGRLVPRAARRVDRLLRSRRTGEKHTINRRLVKLLGKVSDHFGGRTLILVSGFRPYSPKQYTRNSRHNHGKAVDFRVVGVPNRALFEYCRTLPNVGCGYYPNSVFVHMDVRRYKTQWTDYSRPGQKPIYARHLKKRARNGQRATSGGKGGSGKSGREASSGKSAHSHGAQDKSGRRASSGKSTHKSGAHKSSTTGHKAAGKRERSNSGHNAAAKPAQPSAKKANGPAAPSSTAGKT